MWFSKKEFINKCNDLLDDIDTGKLKSPAWVWMSVGAITGLLTSCLKIRRKSGKPILAKMTKVDECVNLDLGNEIGDYK